MGGNCGFPLVLAHHPSNSNLKRQEVSCQKSKALINNANCIKMKEVPTNDASPTDSSGSFANESSDGSRGRGGGVPVAAHRPTPSPPSVAVAASSSSSSSNAVIETTASKAAVEIVAKSEPKGDIARNDDNSHPSCSVNATTPTLPSPKKTVSTMMTMSLQQSEVEGTAVSYPKFTPIRGFPSQSTSRGSGSSIVATPGPTTSRSMDMNLFGQEMLAASSASASAMMDGFGYEEFRLNGESTTVMTPVPPLGEVQHAGYYYPTHQDDYALPPFLQAHLDETYAASSSSSTVILPPLSATDIGNGQDGEILLQLTSCLPNLTTGTASSPFTVTALGTVPPNPIGRRVAVNNGNVHTGSSSASVPLSRATKMATSIPAKTSAIFASSSFTKNRSARSLPLRKRPLREEDESETKTVDTDQIVGMENKVQVEKNSSNRPRGPSTKKPSVKRQTLVRHNYNENRSTCKCAKSRCLKLYCDCFQSGRLCNPEECGCKSCMNLDKYSGPHGERTVAINECLAKNPKAFEKRQKGTDEGCKCKKNK